MPQTHQLDKNAIIYRWDRDAPPALTVDPGDTVVFETPEITRGQITPESTADALLSLDFDLIHQISGPVAIRGAEPGDTLSSRSSRCDRKAGATRSSSPGSTCSRMIRRSRRHS